MDFKDIFKDKALTFDEFVGATKEAKLVDLSKGGYVDLDKFERSEKGRKTLEAQITERDNLLKKFEGVDIEALKRASEDLTNKHNEEVAGLKRSYAIDSALMREPIHDIKAIKAYLDDSIIKLDGENVVGLSEQISRLKENNSFLFKQEKTGSPEEKPAVKVNTNATHTTTTSNDDGALRSAAGLK